MNLPDSLEALSKHSHYPATDLQIIAQRFIDDQVAFARVIGIDQEVLFESNNDLDALGFVNNPFGIKPRPAIWFQLAISAFVEHTIGEKKEELLPAGQGANLGKTTEDAYITTVVDFESLEYPDFRQSSYPVFTIRESMLDDKERIKLIEHLRGLYERWEFSKLYYASIKKINPFNNLLDQICVILARLDPEALPAAKIFPEQSPEVKVFSSDDLFFSDGGNEFYTPNTWYAWEKDEQGHCAEPFYLMSGDASTLKNQGVRCLLSHNSSDPMWGQTGYVPSTSNAVFIDSFFETDSNQ